MNGNEWIIFFLVIKSQRPNWEKIETLKPHTSADRGEGGRRDRERGKERNIDWDRKGETEGGKDREKERARETDK